MYNQQTIKNMKNEQQSGQFKSYFHYCKVISNYEGKRVLPFYLYKIWLHNSTRNKAKIIWRKIVAFVKGCEYNPYPQPKQKINGTINYS
jgi:hypothetical protein